MRPKILIVDDQSLIRDALAEVIGASGRYEAMPPADSGESALDILQSDNPDLVLLDVRMPGLNGIETLREIRQRGLDVAVVFLTLFNETDLVYEALSLDVSGFLLKDVEKDRLLSSLDTVLQGGVVLDPDVAKQIAGGLAKGGMAHARENTPQADAGSLLTNRETDVLDLLRQGLENKKIARELGLSQGTVRNHISSILQKLEVTNRTQAVIRALHLGLLTEAGD